MIRVYEPEAFEDYRVTKNMVMYENHWLTHFSIYGVTKAQRDERFNLIMGLLQEIHDETDALGNPSCYILNPNDYVKTTADTEHLYHGDIVAFFQIAHYDKLNQLIDRFYYPEYNSNKLHPDHWSSSYHPGFINMEFGAIYALRKEFGIWNFDSFKTYLDNKKLSPFTELSWTADTLKNYLVQKGWIEYNYRERTVTDKKEYRYTLREIGTITPSSMDRITVRNKYDSIITDVIKNYSVTVTKDTYPMSVEYQTEALADEASLLIHNEFNDWAFNNPESARPQDRYIRMFSPEESNVREQEDVSVYLIINRDEFDALYNEIQKYVYLSKFDDNGDTLILPSECIYSAELNGSWTLELTYPYDKEERYSYLKEGCVIGVDAKIAREQTNDIQFFRVFDIEYNLNEVLVTAYPVAYEAGFEVPILSCNFCGSDNKGYTAKELVDILNNLQRNKYRIKTTIESQKMSLFGMETNLQELLVGDQDGSFINLYGGEVVFDNYDYVINKQIGDNTDQGAKDRCIQYSSNLTGIQITINTWDLINRIEPMSSEGYSMVPPEYYFERRNAKYWFEGGTRGGGNDVITDDATELRKHPFVHAKVIRYDDVYILKEPESSSTTESNMDENYILTPKAQKQKLTKVEKRTKNVKSRVKNYVKKLSKEYIKKARKGDWNSSSRTKHLGGGYQFIDPRNPGSVIIGEKHKRAELPYGYILYSTEDSKKYLASEAMKDIPLSPEEIEFFKEAIYSGFNWCKSKKYNKLAKWWWHDHGTYRTYGKNKNERVENQFWKVGNEYFWFNNDGQAITKYLNWDGYEWIDFQPDVDEAINVTTIQETTKTTTDSETKVKTTETTIETTNKLDKDYRFGDPNDKSKYVGNDREEANWWIEKSSTEHYRINSLGQRVMIDKLEWVFTVDGDNVYYRSKDGKRYPYQNQFMYVQQKKAWYKFGAGGLMIGPYISKANYSWHKDSKGWSYSGDDGNTLKNQWIKINGKWYFLKHNGIVDKTTDDYDDNKPQNDTTKKNLEVDWNLDGVGGGSNTSSGKPDGSSSDDKFEKDRDGVKAWIQKEFISKVRAKIKQEHEVLWDGMRQDLDDHATKDLKAYTQAAITVEIDCEGIANTGGYEKFKYLQDFKLGDKVHVVSPVHNLDVEERVTEIKYDCLNNEIQEITLGYPKIKKSFINNVAKLHPHGIIQEYTPSVYLEDGYGGYLLTTDPADADVGPSNGLEVD